MKPRKQPRKQGNKKIERDGMTFDSIAEARRYQELLLMQRAGTITDLRCQVAFELIPAQYEEVPTGEFYKIGKRKGQPKMNRVCVEKSLKYIADFVYKQYGETVVEDVKGYKDPRSVPYAKFVIKRKLMLERFGVRVREV